MAAVARATSSIGPWGGTVTSGSSGNLAGGLPIARVGDPVACANHGAQAIATGSPRMAAKGKPVARVGSTCTCGCVITTGFPKVDIP